MKPLNGLSDQNYLDCVFFSLASSRAFMFLSLVFLLLLLPFSIYAHSHSAIQTDPLLTPWTGLWTIVDDRIASSSQKTDTNATIEIRATADGKGLEISRKISKQPDVKEVLIPDGIKRSVQAQNCSGWQSTKQFPETGLLIGTSDMNCKESGPYSTLNLRMILAADQMVDILAIKASGQTRLAIRRLSLDREISSTEDLKSSLAAIASRTALSAPWSVNHIIELSKMVDTPVLQAAILEKNVQLKLDSKFLKQLQSAKLPKEAIDLLVALAFPDKFDIEKNGQVALRPWTAFSSSGASRYSYPSDMTYYPGSFYPYYPYSYYRYAGLFAPDSYWYYYSPGWWDYPIYISGSSGNNGRLSSNRGYVQIEPRDTGHHAQPRDGHAPSSFGRSGTYVPGSSSSPTYYPPSNSSSGSYSAPSGGSSGTSSGGGGSSSPSASPGGYSSGSSSGGQAVPR
jgi:hypothetical protein